LTDATLILLAMCLAGLGLFSGFYWERLSKQRNPDRASPSNSLSHIFLLESLLDKLPVPIFYKDCEGRYLRVNNAFEKFFGTSRDNLLGKTAAEISPPDLAWIYTRQDHDLFQTGGIQLYESQVKNAEGVIKDVVFHKTVLTDEEDHPTGLVGVIFEITEQKNTPRELFQQQQIFHSFAENIPDLVIGYDAQCRRSYVNPAFLELTKLSAEQYLGTNKDVVWYSDISFDEYKMRIKSVFATGESDNFVLNWSPPQSLPILFSMTLVPEKDASGTVIHVFAIGRDITDIKVAELRLNNVMEHWPGEIALYDRDCRRTYVNSLMAQTLAAKAVPENQLLGERPTQTFPNLSQVADYENALHKVMTSGKPLIYDMRWPQAPNVDQYRAVHILPEYDSSGRITGLFTIARDITEQKQAEAERSANLEFLKNLDLINRTIQQSQHLDQVMDDVLDITLELFGCDRSFLLFPLDPETSTWEVPVERTVPEYPGVHQAKCTVVLDEELQQRMQQLLATEAPLSFGPTPPILNPDGTIRIIPPLSELMIALYPKIGPPWLFGIQQCSHSRSWSPVERKLFKEVSKRICDALTFSLAYRDLKKSERFLDNIFDHVPSMLFLKDAKNLRFVRMNKVGEQLTGYKEEELIGKNDYDFFAQEEADFFTEADREVLRDKKLKVIPEETLISRDQRKHIVQTKKIAITDESGEAQFLLGLSEDITEQKNLEGQLYQSQKMEAIGQLAGGVAHDFNNMLGVILGHTELLLDRPPTEEKLSRSLQEIKKAALRSAELTRQLLAFARKQDIAPKILDLNATVEGILSMLRRLIGEDIALAWHPSANLWPIKIDPSQLDQILANLCVNARDAIAKTGKITIETHQTSFNESYQQSHPETLPGDYIMLSVSDDGCGMNAALIDKIFEPFFTTKAADKGTGLGLATVYGIVKQNNGFINVDSEPGLGTTFKIYLPRISEEIDLNNPAEKEPPLPRGTETILLVEDDETILETERHMLELFGYQVLATSTPAKALYLAEEHAETISLLITDVIMPEMNGRELAEKLIARYPNLKYMFMSGYTGDVIANHGVIEGDINFIQKPFTLRGLAVKVREAIDGPTGGAKREKLRS